MSEAGETKRGRHHLSDAEPGLMLHPILVALAPGLFLYSKNVDQMTFADSAGGLLVAYLIAITIWFFASIATAETARSAIITAIITFMLLSSGSIMAFFSETATPWPNVPMRSVLLPLILGITATLVVWVARTQRHMTPITRFANIFAGVMVLIPLIGIVQFWATTDRGATDSLATAGVGAPAVTAPDDTRPDIYYIILDAYTNQAVLDKEFGYDNSPFLASLRKRGFVVKRDSRSNYALTYMSLASSLNQRHLGSMAKKVGLNSTDYAEPTKLIKYNLTARNLKKRGYRIVHFASGWSPTDSSPYADKIYREGILSEAQRAQLESTLLETSAETTVKDYRQRILGTFASLGNKVPTLRGPKFVFAHILAPHPPYVFRADGSRTAIKGLDLGKSSDWKNGKAYVAQVRYLNKKTIATIDKILANSKRRPIIIIQGDHGTAHSVGGAMSSRHTKRLYQERLGALNAYYLPGEARKKLPADITPVNTFRFIRKHYLGDDIELLANESYFSDYKKPYRYRKVTATVKLLK